ncbi:MAG: hypothetical protein EXS05_21940 [Planctomycetaceae bacterium]|nr:hypothetical protein [Planctomycetaceae bacterium]
MTARFSTDLLHSPDLSPGSPDTRGPAEAAADSVPEVLTACRPDLAAQFEAGIVDELFIPQSYESGYAYPLIVWLTAPGDSNRSLAGLMCRISDRNYLGAAVGIDEAEPVEERLFEAVSRLRRRLHVHSERVYVAGAGVQGMLALQVGLARPEWFGGIIALSATFPARGRPLAQFESLRRKRVFLATAGDDPTRMAEVARTQRLLWTAGLDVQACRAVTADPHDAGLLLEIDRWIMQGIEAA